METTDFAAALADLKAREGRARKRSLLLLLIPVVTAALWLSYSVTMIRSLTLQRRELQTGIDKARRELNDYTEKIARAKQEYETLRSLGWSNARLASAFGQQTISGLQSSTPSADNAAPNLIVPEVEASRRADKALLQLVAQKKANKGPDANVRVEYFAKDVDKNIVEDALRSAGLEPVEKTAVGTSPTNAIWAGRKVPLIDVKIVALTLLRAGVRLRSVRSYCEASVRPSTIQIGGWEGYDSWKAWTVDGVLDLRALQPDCTSSEQPAGKR